MTKLIWDSIGTRFYEVGVDKGVIYDNAGNSTVWNGLTNVKEENEDVVETISFIDGVRYLNNVTSSNFKATVSAVTYPDILNEYTGDLYEELANQEIKPFNFTYRTMIGNDISNTDYGYKIHLVYNAKAVTQSTTYTSYGSSITPTDFSWSVSCVPVVLDNLKPSSHFIIDSTKVQENILTIVENKLYGTDVSEPVFPTMEELINIFEENSSFRIIDHGDGTFTAIGNDEQVKVIEPTVFELTSPTVIMLSSDTYKVSTI